MKRVLVVAFHFPPAAMGSGYLRTLGFARYLPASGWEPLVLTASPRAYSRIAGANDALVPADCHVYRTPALDVKRSLSTRGKYFGFLAQPDRWSTWWLSAVWKGFRLIRQERIDAIWSTYPIMTAHCVAHTLHALSGLPWIADFRDPVASSVEAGNGFSVRSQRRWERRVLRRASKVVLTTPGAFRAYASQYPEADREQRLAVIQNGYDEADFQHFPNIGAARGDGPVLLLHSGLLYSDGRDPTAFFTALAELKRIGGVGAETLRVVLRASGYEARYQHQLDRLGIADIVMLAPPVGNREALAEQARADGLLLFQGSKFDHQIPIKLYEYLRAGKPIFAMVGMNGDTAAMLRHTGSAELVPIDDETVIQRRLVEFVDAVRRGDVSAGRRPVGGSWSREHRATELAGLLDEVVAARTAVRARA